MTTRSASRARVPVAVLAAAALLACTSPTEPRERTLTLDVAAERVPCTGFVPQHCYQVREDAAEPWELLYEEIEGLAYEPGFEYTVLVVRKTLEDPPLDSSRDSYRLIVIIRKAAVESDS